MPEFVLSSAPITLINSSLKAYSPIMKKSGFRKIEVSSSDISLANFSSSRITLVILESSGL